jgi:alginate O-acetyltransferase complex protein AlgI
VVFSSSLFLFLFLPVVLAVYFAVHPRLRNMVLLVASLGFYAWGEKALVGVLLVSIVVNWALGLWVERARDGKRGKLVVATAVAFNVGLLIAFKYADWLWSLLGDAAVALGVMHGRLPMLGSRLPPSSLWHAALVNPNGHIHLPIGVSFFTFQAASYVIDVYRRDVEAEKNLVNFGMYKAFFPQLIAGPIVRYRDVHDWIRDRITTREGFATGVRRFVLGLGKKVLIANTVARSGDAIFAIPRGELTTPVAWLGILCYSLQIYFDFSGYSDMAIGLGHMFGFRFLENFNYPYVSKSITDFWRRWHISLSTWFRDYLYIPLGGSRVSPPRTYLNLLIVFFLCGLWHGAAFNFLVWGLFHGVFLVIERTGLGRWIERRSVIVRHAYVLLVVMIGWVFFRAPDLSYALGYSSALFGLQSGAPLTWHFDLFLDPAVACALVAGILGSAPWLPRLVAWHSGLAKWENRALGLSLEVAAVAGLAVVFFLSALELGAGSYNPFIYFRF